MKPLAKHSAAQSPCKGCPWLTSNHGKPHPSGWYTKSNTGRLWSKLRRGETMSCHATDSNNPVTEKDQAAGYKPVPETAQVRECAGATILQEREIELMVRNGWNLKQYSANRPGGLTQNGIRMLISRLVMTIPGEVPMPKLNLIQPVSIPGDKLPWEPPTKAPAEDEA